MTRISETLRGIICRQENNLENYDKDQVVAAIKESKKDKVQDHQNILTDISNSANKKLKTVLKSLQKRGAGAWLAMRPTTLLACSFGFKVDNLQSGGLLLWKQRHSLVLFETQSIPKWASDLFSAQNGYTSPL